MNVCMCALFFVVGYLELRGGGIWPSPPLISHHRSNQSQTGAFLDEFSPDLRYFFWTVLLEWTLRPLAFHSGSSPVLYILQTRTCRSSSKTACLHSRFSYSQSVKTEFDVNWPFSPFPLPSTLCDNVLAYTHTQTKEKKNTPLTCICCQPKMCPTRKSALSMIRAA